MTTHAKTEPFAKANWLCPLARTFADDAKANPHCRGSACPVWRWQVTEPYRKAVTQVGKEIGDKAPYPKAAAIVAADPQKYETEGICGLGGSR